MSDIRKWMRIVENIEEAESVDEGIFDIFKKNKDRKMFQMGQKLDPKRAKMIDDLSDIVLDNDLYDEVMDYLKRNTRFYHGESVELEEKVISDKGIKKALMQITQMASGMKSSGEESQELVKKVKKLIAQMEKSAKQTKEIPKGQTLKANGEEYTWHGAMWTKKSPNGKDVPVSPKRGDPSNAELKQLYFKRSGQDYSAHDVANELTNLLSDYKGEPDWKMAAREVNKAIGQHIGGQEAKEYYDKIQGGKAMEESYYRILTDILRESGSTWFDIGWKPVKLVEGRVHMKPCVPHRDMLIEDVFTDAIMYDKIAKLKKNRK